MSDLVAFLAARLDEDEVAARKAASADHRFGGRAHWSALGHGIVTDAADPEWGVVDLGPCIDDDALAEHIVRHDPARVLREVGAGRAILALHRPELWNSDDDPDDIHCAECTADEDLYKAQIWPCPTVRHLAAVYSDHPDYDPAWAS